MTCWYDHKEVLPDVIAVDFDGTIVEERYPEIGELIPGAKEVINRLADMGICIIINTCRAGKYEQDAINFLNHNGIKYHHINENCHRRIQYYGNDPRKIGCLFQIDNASIHCDKIDWDDIWVRIQKRLNTK